MEKPKPTEEEIKKLKAIKASIIKNNQIVKK